MTLPAEPSHRPVVGRSPRRGKYHNVATTARIVVSDRDPAFRQVLCQRLEAEGYEVRAYEDSIAILENGDVVADALIVTVAPGSTSVVDLQLAVPAAGSQVLITPADGTWAATAYQIERL